MSSAASSQIPQNIADLFDAIDENHNTALEYAELVCIPIPARLLPQLLPAAAQPRRPFQENWWNRLGGNPAELSKLERAFQIAAEQGSSAVDLEVFSHCIIAVATEGWTEQRNPVSGRVWFENPETGEVSSELPGADCVEPYLQRAGIEMASVNRLAVRCSLIWPLRTIFSQNCIAVAASEPRHTEKFAGQHGHEPARRPALRQPGRTCAAAARHVHV